MARVDINPEPIHGPWVDGFVLDRHVVSARPIGYVGEHMQFDTTRTALGELVYQLKYRNGQPGDIIETAVAFVRETWRDRINCVVSAPPSLHRSRQPALLLGDGIAHRLSASFRPAAVVKEIATQQMKNVPPYERAPLLAAAIQAGTESVQGKSVLIVDDLWDTGSTLRRMAEVLNGMGAAQMRALVMTRTK